LTQRPTGIPEISIEIPSEVLQRGIKRISFNPVIEKGRDLKLQVVVHDKHLIMTTNDSYRVAIFEADLDQDVEDACIVTTCPFFLSVVSAIPGDEKVGLGFNNKGLRIRGGNLDVYQPSLQEIEPKDIQAYVQKIQEQTPKISCRASVVEAKRAIREVSSIVPSSFGDTKLGLKFDPRGKVTAKVESSLGETDSSFESQDVKLAGENNRVFFNSRHMYEFLNMLDGEVDMKIWENESILHSEALATTMVITQLT
jgi:DNA polymerase III sliding clamp (beta) subunit (PCNA family)